MSEARAQTSDEATEAIFQEAYTELQRMDEEDIAAGEEEFLTGETDDGPQQTVDEGDTKPLGYGELMQYLRENNPAGAEAMKTIQGNSGKLSNQVIDLNRKLEAIESKLNGDSEATADDEEVDPDLERVTPGQWALFEKMARKRGLVLKDDLAQQETEQAYESHRDRVLREGIEQFGEGFGSLDENGQFTFSDDVREAVQGVTQRLDSDTEGITELELFKLAQFDRLIEAAAEKGREAALDEIDMDDRERLALKPKRTNTTVRKTGTSTRTAGRMPAYDKSKMTADQYTDAIIAQGLRSIKARR